MGLIKWEKRRDVVTFKPNWLTVVAQALGKIFMYSGFDFELPRAFKLLMFQQLVTNDWDMTWAAVSSINKSESTVLPVEGLANRIGKDYARYVMQNIMRRLETSREKFDTSLASKRVNFFAKNLELLTDGLPPTSGFSHQLEARLHWLIDLRFLDNEYLCQKEEIRLSKFVKRRAQLENSSRVRDETDILGEYAESLRDAHVDESLEPFLPANIESLIETSIDSLRKQYGRLLPADAVIYMTRLLAFLTPNKRPARNEILEVLSRKHRVYRDWKGPGAFVELTN